MRLDKFFTNAEGISRNDTKKLIKSGRIQVCGITATKPDMKIDENSDEITLDGRRIIWREFVYLMMNKPSGYVSATYDKKQPYVTQLIPDELAHFDAFPVGRLDIDTTGLLVLTNDGDFAHRVTSPKKYVYKTYRAYLDKPAEPSDIDVFASGMDLGDFIAQPAVLIIDSDDPKSVTVKICEGKFHQVKRMCEKVGKTVVRLERVSIGRLHLDSALASGQIREMSEIEKSMMLENE